MKQYRKFIITIVCTFLLGLIGIGAVVIYIDPFMHYHKPIDSFPYVVDDQLSQVPGLALHEDYDSVLLGSSVTANFSGSWFKEAFDLDLLKLPYNGAYPKDIANAFERVERRHSSEQTRELTSEQTSEQTSELTSKQASELTSEQTSELTSEQTEEREVSAPSLKTVYIAIDPTAYSAPTDQTKYELPSHLYDDNLLTDVSYLYNMDVLLNYIVKPALSKGSATPKEEYFSNYELFDGCFSKEFTLSGYERPDLSDTPVDTGALVPDVILNLQENIIPMIERNPDTNFVFFFPPRSILYWDNFHQTGEIGMILQMERCIIEELLKYPNVEIHYFENDSDIITNLDNYMDMTHYSRDICEQLVIEMASGNHLLTADNYEDILDTFETWLYQYDYDSIFE